MKSLTPVGAKISRLNVIDGVYNTTAIEYDKKDVDDDDLNDVPHLQARGSAGEARSAHATRSRTTRTAGAV